MRKARNGALEILKPTKKQLEHGLELHANSIVCDAYGFAPYSTVDSRAIISAIKSGASQVEYNQMMAMMRTSGCITEPAERQEYLDAWQAAGVTCIVQNASGDGKILDVIKILAHFTWLADMLAGFVRKMAVPGDIVAAKKQNKACLCFSFNSVPLPENWNTVEEELLYIGTFFELGVRMMHLTYNRRNMIGDGCGEPADAGLSDFGREVIAEMNRVGVIVDVAHSGWRTSLEAAKISRKPMVASHSGCCAMNMNCRCKPDEVISAIADTGGYVGICCFPAFLGRSGDINALLDHVDHVAQIFGVDHVAIGTDINYVSIGFDREIRKVWKVLERLPVRPPWRSLWPKDSLTPPKGGRKHMQRLSLAWTNWPLFTVGLVQRGYSDKDIQKIIGGNVLRVMRAVWPIQTPEKR